MERAYYITLMAELLERIYGRDVLDAVKYVLI